MELSNYYLYIPSFAANLLLILLTIKFTLDKKEYFVKRAYLFIFPGLFLLLLLFTVYLLGRSFLAEYYYNKSFQGTTVTEVYNSQRQAVLMNPNKDHYRIAFSRTNLLIANSLADKVKPSSQKEGENVLNAMSPEDKQTATKAIQAAIEEAQAAVKLDENNPRNWENLGDTYRHLLNIAENAGNWAVSSYQRAIALDRENPQYHLKLGGAFFLQKKYGDAIRSFEEAAKLRPDWPNVYYNLAWTYHEQGDKKRAISNMEKTISLLNKQGNEEELNKAKIELDLFKRR